ncbi:MULTISPECIES: sensor histidine kinase [Roseivirga]|uniref:histidine kinase n=1 Tax=Roseivirga spongicola TaxID=333140 RepID=A0A150X3N4_9BACT|nr:MULTISPECIES: ATP-binding protein [Roseivirga]KYG73345.1 hypothetical protein AWW68_11605 [Roseivirga spongicola]MBO6659588.1 GHKL domain-containing protein [Roseivirga sp.]MBO6907675.1 GHKL domain-containing protein [Roseivirga sp.]WPZ10045.1 ATP-binding protein [Roseivirga spongicola]
MIFRDYKFQIVFRLGILTLLGYGLLYYTFIDVNYIRVFFLGIFSLIVLIALFYYLIRVHKLTSSFLDAILNNDFTVKYPEQHENKSIKQLFRKFNLVNERFSQSIQEQANQYQYLLALINQLKIAVVAFDARERVHVVNSAFKELVNEKEVIRMSSLKSLSPHLYKEVISLEPNQQKVVKAVIGNTTHQFSVAASIFKLRQKQYTLVSMQDIHSELDQNEMQAWQKLIRVLTHEIMNSVAPVVSLSGSLESIVQSTNTNSFEENKKTLLEGMDAIKVRSQGLMNFTQAYRKLTRVPAPNLKEVEVSKFLQPIETLFRQSLTETDIKFTVQANGNANLLLDPDLMQQVLINLLKNAQEAVKSTNGEIRLTYNSQPDGQTTLIVSDNGTGIPEEIADQIFIPFYTTKTEGSGIGLSLAKQIIQQHGGQLTFETSNNGTSFYIKL